jgi:hypothetical protein
MGSLQSNQQHTERVKEQHVQFQDVLPAYATAIVLGQEKASRFQGLVRHIAECTECEQTLVRLLDAIEPIYNGTFEPVAVQQFDLSFLPAAINPAAQSSQEFEPGQHMPTTQRNQFVVPLDHLLAKLGLTNVRPSVLQPRSTFGTPVIDYEPDPAVLDGASMSIQLYHNEGDPEHYDLQLALILPAGRSAPNGFRIAVHSDDAIWAEEIDESGVLYAMAIVPRTITKLQIVADILP